MLSALILQQNLGIRMIQIISTSPLGQLGLVPHSIELDMEEKKIILGSDFELLLVLRIVPRI